MLSASEPSILGDTYRLIVIYHDIEDWWRSDDLGFSGTFTLGEMPEGAMPGKVYAWQVLVYNAAGGYGASFESRAITFATTTAGSGPHALRGEAALERGSGRPYVIGVDR